MTVVENTRPHVLLGASCQYYFYCFRVCVCVCVCVCEILCMVAKL